jgi:2-amino-4-hydroxy-6-hydroxymethyldihydropteridine diphosphokinase
VKEIERHLGRQHRQRYGPREIDIDLLFYDQLILQTAELTLPHPRLAERAFVLAPLAEIAPALIHPVLGKSMEALLQGVPGGDVQRLGPLPDSAR